MISKSIKLELRIRSWQHNGWFTYTSNKYSLYYILYYLKDNK